MSSGPGEFPFVVLRERCVDLAGDVPFQAADDLAFALALAGAPFDVVLGGLVVAQADEHDPVERGVGLAVAASVERWRFVLPEQALIGEEPQSIEKAASERSRSGLSPAATSSAPAVSAPTPNASISCGEAVVVSRASWPSRLRISTSSVWQRRARCLSASLLAASGLPSAPGRSWAALPTSRLVESAHSCSRSSDGAVTSSERSALIAWVRA